MGLWSGLKTIGSELVSGAKSFSRGAGRLRDAIKYGTSERPRYFGNLVREAPEAEIRAAAVNAERIGLSEKISLGTANILDDEAEALFNKELSEKVNTANFEKKLGNVLYGAESSAETAVVNPWNKQKTAAVRNVQKVEDRYRNFGKQTAEQEEFLRQHAPEYEAKRTAEEAKAAAQDRAQRSESARISEKLEDAEVTATGTTQPDAVAAANENMGAKAQAISETKSVGAAATKEGIESAPSTAGQAEATVQKQQALDNLPNIPIAKNSGLRDTALGMSAIIGGDTLINGWRNPSNRKLYKAGAEKIMLPGNMWNYM